MNRNIIVTLVLMSAAVLESHAQQHPYLFSRVYENTGQGSVQAGTYAGYGMRSTRPFGEDGFEQRLNLSAGLFDWLKIMAEYGYGWTGEGDFLGSLVNANLQVKVLDSEKHFIDLSIMGGYIRDYAGVNIAALRFIIGKGWGRFNLTGTGYLEFPFDSQRDAADLVMTLGFSYAVADSLKLAVELAGEDLEGFWEADEAEGGARFLAGPNIIWGALPGKLDLMAGAAFIMKATHNTPAYGQTNAGRYGFISRLELRWRF